MDAASFLRTCATGLATGLGIMVALTLVLLPISYVMNRYIYHHWTMRLLLAVLTVVALPIAWIGLFFVPRIHYFGLVPLLRSGDATAADPEGWFAGLWRFLNILKHPFLEMMSEPDDQTAWMTSMSSLLITDPQKQRAVPESLWEEARRIAVIESQGAWQTARDALASRMAGPQPPK